MKRPEPTMIIQLLASVVVLAGTLGYDKFTPTQAGLVTAAIVAVAAGVNSVFVRPASVPLIAGAITAVAAALSGWGLNLSPELTGALTFVILNLLSFLGTRDQATPTSDPKGGGGVPVEVAAAARTSRNLAA